jgi:hypothetical protein
VPESNDGIEAMRERMARASRKPPPARRSTVASGGQEKGVLQDAGGAQEAAPSASRVVAASGVPAPAVRRRASTNRMRLAPDLPPVNLAIRVRRPLDDRLADLIHTLRQRGVRTSKVELIEMLLWELPEPVAGADEILDRLGRFRARASRAVGGAIPGESTR